MEERVDATVCYRHPDRPTRLACSECGRPICIDCSNDAPVGQKCPECARAPGRHQVIQARRSVGMGAGFERAPVSRVILYATVAVQLLVYFNRPLWNDVANALAHANPALADGEVWRMVTHALLHSPASMLHILFNMYALYLFGPALERRVGSLPFGLFYAAAAAGGSAMSYVVGPPEMVAVGASGAIFGLFGAWLYSSWRVRHTAAGGAQFNQLMVLLAINLALPLFIPSVAWQAHVGGLLAGLAMAAAWSRIEGPDSLRRRALAAVGVLAVSVAVVLVL
ncbi:MAG TPA: rhomboid family intramembrane serine protease [Acidimicrobiia bacterium]|jgi:membrane associated rhomboid family serine protease